MQHGCRPWGVACQGTAFTCLQSYLQGLPVEADVQVVLQVRQQGVTNDDVIRAGVVVQLLVPFFHHASLSKGNKIDPV